LSAGMSSRICNINLTFKNDMMKKIKIIIVDDHTILRHGLCEAFNNHDNFTVIAQTDNGRQAVELTLLHRPDIILMDVSMPDFNGMETTRQILKINTNIKVIALSMHSEKIYVMGMLNAGASGYILKSCSFNELVICIKTVLSGRTCFCREVADHLLINTDDQRVNENNDSVFSILSDKEREVLQLIAEGHKSRQIAARLNISIRTVDVHRVNLKRKLNIRTVAELTKFAITEGITSL